MKVAHIISVFFTFKPIYPNIMKIQHCTTPHFKKLFVNQYGQTLVNLFLNIYFEPKQESGGTLVRGDWHKTSRHEGCSLTFLTDWAYDPELLGAGARQYIV
jgi:hypothetical protein